MWVYYVPRQSNSDPSSIACPVQCTGSVTLERLYRIGFLEFLNLYEQCIGGVQVYVCGTFVHVNSTPPPFSFLSLSLCYFLCRLFPPFFPISNTISPPSPPLVNSWTSSTAMRPSRWISRPAPHSPADLP